MNFIKKYIIKKLLAQRVKELEIDWYQNSICFNPEHCNNIEHFEQLKNKDKLLRDRIRRIESYISN